jgi:hypothetical protein
MSELSPTPASQAPHEQLAQALRERRQVIADREFYQRDPQAHLRELQKVSEHIVALQGQLPRPLDPMFAHYLERCSYDKALAWLETADKARARHQE